MNIKKYLLVSIMSVASIGSAIAGPTNVPLTGTISFIGTMAPNMDPATSSSCPLLGMNYGGGTLSHLGKTALVSTDCITPDGTGLLLASNGNLTLTAANGDTVTGTYHGAFVPNNNGAYQFSNVTFSITGGSGRFSRAYGKGVLNGIQDTSGKGTITIDGTISY